MLVSFGRVMQQRVGPAGLLRCRSDWARLQRRPGWRRRAIAL